jgi:hypothetical protein
MKKPDFAVTYLATDGTFKTDFIHAKNAEAARHKVIYWRRLVVKHCFWCSREQIQVLTYDKYMELEENK